MGKKMKSLKSKSLKPKSFKSKSFKKLTSRINKTPTETDKINVSNSKFNFSYIISHSCIVTSGYDYHIRVPDNIRLIQYTPKGNLLNIMDVLCLFNKFKKNPIKKGIIEKPQYYSLNKNKQIFESDLQLTVTKPGHITNNLFLQYNDIIKSKEFCQNLIDNRDKLPVLDVILNEDIDDIESYLHMGLYDCINNKNYDLDKLGNMENLLDDLTINSNTNNSNTKNIISKSNSITDYILYTEKDKKNHRFTLQEVLNGLSNYYKKIFPKGKIVNFVQLGCNAEDPNKKKYTPYTIKYEDYKKNEENKECGLFSLTEFMEIQKRIRNNENKNILNVENLNDHIYNGYIMSSNKSDVEEYLENMMEISSK
jgi:hypothetical protein